MCDAGRDRVHRCPALGLQYVGPQLKFNPESIAGGTGRNGRRLVDLKRPAEEQQPEPRVDICVWQEALHSAGGAWCCFY